MANYHIDLNGNVTKNGEAKKKKKKLNADYHIDLNGNVTNLSDADIGPVKEEKKWYQEIFKKPEAFDDGYQPGDVLDTAGSSLVDAGVGIVKGGLRLVEGLGDLGLYGMQGVSKLVGADEAAEWFNASAKQNTVDELFEPYMDSNIKKDSVFGRTGDAASEAVGSALSLVLTAGLGAAGGLSAAGTTALTTGTTFTSSMGSGMSEAYNADATDEEALKYGLMKGGTDAVSELIFGGLGKTVNALGVSRGISSLDDMFARKVSEKITNNVAKNSIEFGIKASGEGLEEVLAGYGDAVAKKLTYMSDEDLKQLVEDENLLESFVLGAFASGVVQGPQLNSSIKTGTDFVTGLTANEQKVVDKVYNDAIAESETDGKKLAAKEKNKLYEDTVKALEKGYIDIDTIESVVGGDTYSSWKVTADQEMKTQKEYDELYQMKNGEKSDAQIERQADLKKFLEDNATKKTQLREKLDGIVSEFVQGSRLSESYNEQTRKGQRFEADLSQYTNESAKQTVKNFMEHTESNNTNRTHDYLDFLTKISEDRGYVFDFTTTAQLQESIENGNPHGIDVDPERVEAFVSGKNKTIVINMDAKKSLNSLVGHEVVHTLEGFGEYDGLQEAVFKLAQTRGEYADRLASIQRRYKGLNEDGQNKELTSDLLGDYLFTDYDFIKGLSVEKPNIFKRVYNEIKYLYKMATAGSREARELERVKHMFEKAWRENGEENAHNDSDIKFSIRTEAPPKETGIAYKVFYVKDGKLYPPMVANPDGADTPVGIWLDADVGASAPPSKTGRQQVKAGGKGTQGGSGSLAFRPGWHLGDLPRASQFDRVNPETGNKELFPENFVWAEVEYAKDVDYQEEAMSYGYTDNGKFRHAYAGLPKLPENGYYRYRTNPKPDTVPWIITGAMKVNRLLSDAEVNAILEQNGVAPVHRQGGDVGLDKFGFNEDGSVKYSISDSKGRQLTKGQQEFFKNSKARDDAGNLMVVYHGSQDYGFTVFDNGKSDDNMSFFFTNSEDMANSYVGDKSKLYETYLNLENPYIVDAKGHRWNQIRLGENTDAITGKVERFVDLSMAYDVEIDFALVSESLGNVSDSVEYMLENEMENLDDGEESLYSDAEKAELRQLAREIDEAYENWDEEAHLDEDGEPMSMSVYLLDHKLSTKYTTRQIAKIAKNQGHDGVIIKNVYDNGKFTDVTGIHGFGNVYIAFDSNQIKSVDNANPTKNADIRYSLSDSDGNQLTEEQQEYFKDSKARDKNGNLLRVYHTTNSDFTVFDKSRKGENTGAENTYFGFFFSESEDYMKNFPEFRNGKTTAYYLDIKNPLDMTNVSKQEFLDVVELLGHDVTEAAEFYDRYLEEEIQRAKRRGDNEPILILEGLLETLYDDYYDGDFYEALKPNYDKFVAKGYDGVINYMDELSGEKEYVVFDSNQAKLTTNVNPSTDSDVRYSLSEDSEIKSVEDIRAKYKDKTDHLYLYEKNDTVSIDNMVVKKELRNQGIGTQILNDVIAYADKNGKTITLTPTSEFGTKEKLKKWYKANGFVENKGRNTNFLFRDTMYRLPKSNVRYSLSEDSEGRKLSQEQNKYFENAKTRDEQGRLKPYYHGTGRADRVGNVFLPERATSGPMAFFTDSKKIADNYARDKEDTSLAYDDMYRDYYTQFRVEVDGQNLSISEAWNKLPVSKKVEIRNKAPHITWDDDMENIIYDENADRGTGGFDRYRINEHKGNYLSALTGEWLEDGNLFGQEEEFLKVLSLVGLDNVQYMNPDARNEKTYQVYLNVTNPFVTTDISEEMLQAFKDAAAETEITVGNTADMWDKRNFSPEAWIEKLEADIANGTSYSWTSIPDFVTDTLKAHGYDGIFDEGGKNGGAGHQVVIPFYSEQIKNIDNESPTSDTHIDMSLSDGNEHPVEYGTYNVYGKDIALQQDIAPVAEPVQAQPETVKDFGPLTEDQANERDTAQIEQSYFIDEDGLPVREEGYNGTYAEHVKPSDPFYEKDIWEVGRDRKVKAYMYENPEVKPFFQQEARYMLGELDNSVKGEKFYNDQLYYDTNGEMGFFGTTRQTSDDIAYLLDTFNYTYKQIAKGLNDIIEDNGKENNAISKRIEFLLDERLRNGYKDFPFGDRIPPNQEYINLLNSKQITEYNDEAWNNWLRGLSEDDINNHFRGNAEVAPAPQEYIPSEDIAPINLTEELQQTWDDVDSTSDEMPLYESKDGKLSMFEEPEGKRSVTRKELHENIVDSIRSEFAVNGYDLDDVLNGAKNLSTFATVDNTPQRVMEKALGYKQGQILSDLTVNRVAQNETEGTKWLRSFTDRKHGLLAQISKQYGIKPGSKESAAAQMYAEGFYVDENNNIIAYGDAELAKDFPNRRVQANIKGLAKDGRIRQIYDETLRMINESRTRNAYPEIPRLENYFLHFRAMDDTFSRLGLPFNPNDIRAKDLPTDLNGVTADLKPGQPYFSSAMHRTGKRTSFDLLGGLERYLTSAKNQIYHIDDIQTLRALRNYIADTYGQAHGLEGLDTLTEEEAQERIKEVYGSHLSTFAKFLNEEANILAGKTALIDRGLEGIIGRRGITFLDTVNRQVGSNMVGFNLSSSMTNFLPVVQTIAKSNKADFIRAFAQTASNKIGSIFGRNDGFAEQSPVMIRRKGADRFYRTPWQKAGDAGYAIMGAVDSISTELIARTKYNELTRKGMDAQKAHYETDKWVSRLMGDRSLGQQPQLYNSKMLGLITKFQLEVRNQLDSQFYDTIQEAKASNEDIQNGLARNAKTAAKVASTFAQLAVVQHLFGKAFESVAGYNPAFDIIEVLLTAFGYDDDEESEDTALDNIEQGFLALLEDLPYTGTLTGGRIPIASALPVEQFITGKDDYGNEKSRWETLKEVAPYYALPTGYGQTKKTYQGLSMFDDDLPIAGSYTDSGNLRFPVEDTLQNRVQAGVFGQWSSDVARDYFDNERNPLKEKQIEELVDLDMPIREYWDYREGLAKQQTLEDKFDYIADLDVSVEQKNIMINNVVDRKEPVDMSNYDDFADYEEFDFYTKNTEKYNFLEANGVSYSEYIADKERKEDYDNAYSWYKNNPEKVTVSKAITDNVIEYRRYTSELNDIRADKDSDGDSIAGSAKEKKSAYINGLDLDYGQKIILFRTYYDSKADKAAYNADIVEYLNGRDDISYEEMVTILEELDMKVHPDGTVTW